VANYLIMGCARAEMPSWSGHFPQASLDVAP
jgi:hypothetical protein